MIWKYIKADALFRDYLPHIRGHKNKIRGKNGRGNSTEFSDSEKREIKTAIKKMVSENIEKQ